MAKTLTLYLAELLLWQVKRGKNPFLARLIEVLEGADWDIALASDATSQRLKSVARPGYALFYEDDPFHARALTVRQSYLRPFWRIEASAKRWEWDVARARFDPEQVDPRSAAQFGTFWRKKLGLEAERSEGFVYVPLQGKLTQKRSFQAMSPLRMLETVVSRAEGKRVIATLHPREHYSDTERAKLAQMVDAGRIELSDKPMQVLLPRCDYVATENSSVAAMGYFLAKPALLFGQIDFHHIAEPANMAQLPDSFDAAVTARPAFDRYVHWFWQENCINAGRADARAKILARFQRFGWPIE